MRRRGPHEGRAPQEVHEGMAIYMALVGVAIEVHFIGGGGLCSMLS